MSDAIKTDLRLAFNDNGDGDIVATGDEAGTVDGKDNLVQALTMRILVGRGEISDLGHSRFGSRVHELIGEPLDHTNLELLRRLVRAALKSDPRVTDVTRVVVTPRPGAPGAVDVDAAVKAVTGETVGLSLALDLG
jgi:phage baseplate assembly protein W